MQNLSSLSTFVIAAKHLSFTKAAKELFLTQGAVSIQIKQMEEELGFKVFRREARNISLTEEGEDLLQSVKPALKQIQTTIESIHSKNQDSSLTISTLPSFAAKWLIPRLPQFQELYPDIALRVHTSDSLIDFTNDKIDCAIRFGLGNYPELFVTHLIDEIYFPVCGPGLIKKEHPLEDPEDIQYYQILHDDYAKEKHNVTWKRWAEIMNVPHLDLNRGLQYGQSDFVIQAAIAGQGIAMARISLVGDDLQAGHLIPLFNRVITTKYAFHFVCPEEYKAIEKVAVFRDWINKTMKKEQVLSGKMLKL